MARSRFLSWERSSWHCTTSSGTGGAEEVFADIGRIELDIELTGFREHGHGSGRCLDAALGFRLGHALYAVHAGFVFHHAVYAVEVPGAWSVISSFQPRRSAKC